MKYLKYINESVNDNFYYHYTSARSILNILKINRFNLSSYIGKNHSADNFFYMALCRTPSAMVGYARMDNCRIVFKKDKLRNNFKIRAIDDWSLSTSSSSGNPENYPSFKTGDLKNLNYEINQRYEYEDRLFSNKSFISNIIDYIERIDLLVTENDHTIAYCNRIFNLCKKLNIKVFAYKTKKDMSYGINPLPNVEDKDIDVYISSDYSKDFRWTTMLALILYNEEYLLDGAVKYDIFDYCEKNGFFDIIKSYNSKQRIIENIVEEMYSLRNGENVLNGLNIDLQNFFKSGKSGPIRNKVNLLISCMTKVHAKSLYELRDFKVKGILPEGTPKKDWSSIVQIGQYHKDHYEKDAEVTYIPISNNLPFNSLRGFYYLTYSYGGKFDKDDFEKIREIDQENKPISNLINYLLNKYTIEVATEKINNAGYDDYDKCEKFKLIKIK